MKPLKVVITGPEGSGKSILANTLSSYFKCPLITDVLGNYLDRTDITQLTQDDLKKVAQQKLQIEQDKASEEDKLIIIDGDLFMLKIWFEFKFNEYPKDLRELVEKQFYNLYILTSPEGKAKYDFKREDPSLRNYFFNAYKKELQEHSFPYIIVEGEFYERKKSAAKAIETLIRSS